jgi:hypothetical protein
MKRETEKEREGWRWSEKEKFWELAGLRAFFFGLGSWYWITATGTGSGMYGLCLFALPCLKLCLDRSGAGRF